MDFYSLLTLLLSCEHILILIGQMTPLTDGPLPAFIFFLETHESLGGVKSKLLSLAQVLKQNIVLLRTLHMNLFGYGGF